MGEYPYYTIRPQHVSIDMVRWTQLITNLLEHGVSPVFLRLNSFIYRNQYCDVRWNGQISNKFSVSNGVRQGAVSSPIFFCINVDELIQEMRKSGVGCSIGGYYYGIMQTIFFSSVLVGMDSKVWSTFVKSLQITLISSSAPIPTWRTQKLNASSLVNKSVT